MILAVRHFFQDPESDYAKDYKYMMVEFFCKENQGVVMRVFLLRVTYSGGVYSMPPARTEALRRMSVPVTPPAEPWTETGPVPCSVPCAPLAGTMP